MTATEDRVCSRVAALAGREAAILASRATLALVAVLRALHLPPDSEVLLPATLCANPATAVRLAGLRPLFADVSPLDLTLDLAAAERRIGRQTRAMIAVPLFGHSLSISQNSRFAARHNLALIEDAAHAVGLQHDEGPAGSLGLCSIFSFGRGKIADAGGGAAVVGDGSLLQEVKAQLGLIQHTQNYDLCSISNALDRLPEELEARAQGAQLYRTHLALAQGSRVTHLQPHSPSAARWLYSVLLPDRAERDAATRDLLGRGVRATNLYPPLPLFFPEARDPDLANYPVAWDSFTRIVNLPLPIAQGDS